MVKAAHYRVGSNVLEFFGNSNLENVTWFVNDVFLTNVLETGANGTVVSGSKSYLLSTVQNGADIQYKMYTTCFSQYSHHAAGQYSEVQNVHDLL